MDLSVHLLVGAMLLAGGGDRVAVQEDPWMRITIALETDGTARATLQVDDPALMPDTLRAIAETEDGVEETADGGLALAFAHRPLDRIPEILAHLPPDRSGVSVLIRIPPDLEGGDLWEFQAHLSAARIRRVRIERDDPTGAVHRPEASVPGAPGSFQQHSASSIHPALQPASEVP